MIKSSAITINPHSTFSIGYNNLGNSKYEVVEHFPSASGTTERILLTGISREKANAIALILNSREE